MGDQATPKGWSVTVKPELAPDSSSAQARSSYWTVTFAAGPRSSPSIEAATSPGRGGSKATARKARAMGARKVVLQPTETKPQPKNASQFYIRNAA